jgi:hypothetical protein
MLLFFRIERLWREIWHGVTKLYYDLFNLMEVNSILDVDDEIHIRTLHLVFIPRIQSHLNRFKQALQQRPLRTEHNKSPIQLWIEGQSNCLDDDLGIEISDYGIDLDGPVTLDTNPDSVIVPETQLPDDIPVAVRELISRDSDCLGIDIFKEIICLSEAHD